MSGVRPVGVYGLGAFAPPRVVTNDELSKRVDTSDEWIRQRTGIRERRLADPGVATSDLAAEAGRAALVSAGVRPEEVDLILLATCTPDRVFPTAACYAQQKIGCVNAGALDLNAACTGFLYGFNLAYGAVASGLHRNVLVIGAETLSTIVDFTDRATCILFGDGAGAMLLRPSDGDGREILFTRVGAEGGRDDAMMVPAGGSRMPITREVLDQKLNYMTMNGREIFKFAVTKIVELTLEALAKTGLKPEQISLVVPHQVNIRILEAACERIPIPIDRFYTNLDRYGNTSAASVPLALEEAVRNGRLKRGDHLLMVAFGAGLTWASAVVRW